MDIIARWRDAITDPPADGWDGLVRHKYSHGYGHGFHVWYASGEYADDDGDVIMDVDSEWLDVTDEPAVAVANVQAAVDSIQRNYDNVETLDDIRHYTGVRPTEVQ